MSFPACPAVVHHLLCPLPAQVETSTQLSSFSQLIGLTSQGLEKSSVLTMAAAS